MTEVVVKGEDILNMSTWSLIEPWFDKIDDELRHHSTLCQENTLLYKSTEPEPWS